MPAPRTPHGARASIKPTIHSKSCSVSLTPAAIAGERLANKELRNRCEVRSTVVYETEDGERHPIRYEPGPSAQARRIQALQIGSDMRKADAVAYCVIHEVWMTEHEAGVPITEMPSQHAGRIDGLVVSAHDMIGSKGRCFRIERSTRPFGLTELECWNAGEIRHDIWDGLLAS